MITRRKLFMACAGVLTLPFGALAQTSRKIRRIGILMESDLEDYATVLGAFRSGMRELGYAEGRDYVFELRSAMGDMARVRELAVELVELKVDLIIPTGTPSALAARDTTREIPILFAVIGNPVGSGLAASLRRPGGNATGLTILGVDLVSKRLDLLRQIVPDLRRVGYVHEPGNVSTVKNFGQLQSDCARLGCVMVEAPIRKREEIAALYAAMKRDKVQGLVMTNPGAFTKWRPLFIEQAARHRLPAVYGARQAPELGGLITYFVDVIDNYRRAAAYVDKIFKGAKPGELPIEMPTRFELVINLKTAKALGLTIPPSVMVQATRVIE